MLERIIDNIYMIDLPDEYNISATFNVDEFPPFDAGEDLRMNHFKERGNDAIQELQVVFSNSSADSSTLNEPL